MPRSIIGYARKTWFAERNLVSPSIESRAIMILVSEEGERRMEIGRKRSRSWTIRYNLHGRVNKDMYMVFGCALNKAILSLIVVLTQLL